MVPQFGLQVDDVRFAIVLLARYGNALGVRLRVEADKYKTHMRRSMQCHPLRDCELWSSCLWYSKGSTCAGKCHFRAGCMLYIGLVTPAKNPHAHDV